ncbi:MAG TPA: hypothetical protein VF070_17630 [Streptosporangiaceae bacterium]
MDTLSAVLRERCGVAEAQLRVLRDPPDAKTMAEAVTDEARAAENVLVIYYLGHGLIGPGDELYLSACGTGELTPGLAAHQALRFSVITEAVSACHASCVVVILDCCFSARAAFGPRSAESAFTLPATHGIYLLASAERLALAPEDQEFTMFSGALIALLTQGDPRGPRMLTLDDAYDFVFRAMREDGGPLPRRQAGDRSGELILTANQAQPPPVLAESADGDATVSEWCPYLGLSAFGVDDAELFHGREKMTVALTVAAAEAMASSSLLAVVGPSGAGKSSLLCAGLLARLRQAPAELPGAATWPWITLTPGEHPLEALAARLSPDRTVTVDDLRKDPARSAGLAAALLRQAPGSGHDPAPRRLVLVIDQLEQLFLPGVSPAERAAFLTAVQAVLRPPDDGPCQALVVLALRADFYGQAAEYLQLREALSTSQFIVGPMSPAELRDAIEAPARWAGLRLDEGLADLILHELGAVEGSGAGPAPGALPLLSHVLWAIWQRRQGARLTVAGYREAGRVAGAIARSADDAYDTFSAQERDAVRRMLPRLVRVGGEAPDTIRELPPNSLLHGLPDQQAAHSALGQLAAARLVTLDRGTVRLSHEALLRSWPRLREWINAARDWLKAVQRLTGDARAWRESGKDQSRLYRGATLAGIREKAAEGGRSGELPPETAEFLAASERQERRAANVRKTVVTVLSVLLVLALAGGGTTLGFQRQAQAQRNAAVARSIAAEASQLDGEDPNLATQLSLIANQVDSQVATGAVIASQGNPGALDDGIPALDMAEAAGGRVLAVSTGTGIRLLDLRTGAPLASIGGIASGPVATASGAPILVAATGPLASLYPLEANADNESGPQDLQDLRVWSIADSAHPSLLAMVPAHTAKITSLAISPSGRLIAIGSPDGIIRVWSAAEPRHLALVVSLHGNGKAVYSLAFDRRGLVLAASGADHETRLWSLSRPESPRLLARIPSSTGNPDSGDPAMPHRVAFSADGRYLAVAAGSGTAEQPEVWNVRNPRTPRKLAVPASDSGISSCEHLMGLAFAPSGKVLFSSCDSELDDWALNTTSRPGGYELQEQTSYSEPSSGLGTGGQVIADAARHAALTVGAEGVQVWQVNAQESGALASLFAGSGITPGSVTLNSAGPPLLADSANLPDVRLWNLGNPANPVNLGLYPELIPSGTGGEADALAEGVALSGDGNLLAASEVVNGRPAVALRRTGAAKAPPAATIRDLSDGAIALALSRDGHLLAVSDNSNYTPAITRPPAVRLYSLRDLAHPRLLASLPGNTFRVIFSPDGRMLVALTANMMLSWDIANPGGPVELPPQHLSRAAIFADGAFSPDGTMLAVQDGTGVLWLWHLAHDRLTGAPVIVDHQPGGGTAVAFSPDSLLLASSGLLNGNIDDSTVDLWDLSAPGDPRLSAQWTQSNAGYGDVAALGFSPAGRVLVVETGNYINIWSTDPARIAGNLCDTIGDTITLEQWQRYVPGLPYQPPCHDGVPASP